MRPDKKYFSDTSESVPTQPHPTLCTWPYGRLLSGSRPPANTDGSVDDITELVMIILFFVPQCLRTYVQESGRGERLTGVDRPRLYLFIPAGPAVCVLPYVWALMTDDIFNPTIRDNNKNSYVITAMLSK